MAVTLNLVIRYTSLQCTLASLVIVEMRSMLIPPDRTFCLSPGFLRSPRLETLLLILVLYLLLVLLISLKIRVEQHIHKSRSTTLLRRLWNRPTATLRQLLAVVLFHIMLSSCLVFSLHASSLLPSIFIYP